MDYSTVVAQFTTHATALREAALAAGPDAPTGTCPEWTVLDLVRHHAGALGFATSGITTPSDAPAAAEVPAAPTEWPAALAIWDDHLATLTSLFTTVDPAKPCWTLLGRASATAGFWARRMAHEAAIHRLDAEHALAGDISPSAVPDLVFEPEFAEDGIDELFTLLPVVRWRGRSTGVTGTALVHAADTGRAWQIRLSTDAAPEVDSTAAPSDAADVTVAGPADAVYRAIWGRPNTAVVTGDTQILTAALTPP